MVFMVLIILFIFTVYLIFSEELRSRNGNCPKCGSDDVEEVGDRELIGNISISRHVCHKCGYKFTKSHVNIRM